MQRLSAPVDNRQTTAALVLAVLMAATVITALGFEHIGGYIPCALCLQERTPYYLGAPLMLIAFINSALSGPAFVTRGLLVIGGLLMTYGAVLGVFHSGVEWHFWPGPETCSSGGTNGVTTNAGDLLADLNSKKPPACDAAALRVLGLSFAGWNVVASVILAAAAYRMAFKR